MRIPDFESATNETRKWTVPPYHVDSDDPAGRKFKEEIEGVRIYEGGLVEIQPRVYRRPHIRYRLHKHLGLNFINPYEAEAAGNRYRTPEGKVVKKTWLERGYFIYDERHKMVVKAPARFYGGHSRLVSETPIQVAEYRKALADEFRAKHKDLFNLALSYSAVQDAATRAQYYHIPYWEIPSKMQSLPSIEDVEGGMEAHKGLLLWLGRAQRNGLIDTLIHKSIRHRYEVPFLYYEEV